MSASGGCLCGAVRYRTEEPLRHVHACHCTQCRKSSGHFVAATDAPRDSVTITGTEAITWFESSPGIRRGFCSRCGSQLFWDDRAGSDLSIGAGTVDTGLEARIETHIFCASKGHYYDIEASAEQWPGAPDPVGMAE